ncbi:MAG: ATP-binding protein, partial [Chloroflexi bacterium]|nr:ATP-binding protein [Chloroflexota bacterium]
VIQELETIHPDRVIQLSTHGSTSAECDPGRTAQIASNLLSNALRYSPESTSVDVVIRGAESQITMEVTNHGEAIPAEVIPSIFDPYYRSEASTGRGRTSAGLGLGLYIVEQVALAHGGSVSVLSSTAAGTTFSVSLPRGSTDPV